MRHSFSIIAITALFFCHRAEASQSCIPNVTLQAGSVHSEFQIDPSYISSSHHENDRLLMEAMLPSLQPLPTSARRMYSDYHVNIRRSILASGNYIEIELMQGLRDGIKDSIEGNISAKNWLEVHASKRLPGLREYTTMYMVDGKIYPAKDDIRYFVPEVQNEHPFYLMINNRIGDRYTYYIIQQRQNHQYSIYRLLLSNIDEWDRIRKSVNSFLDSSTCPKSQKQE